MVLGVLRLFRGAIAALGIAGLLLSILFEIIPTLPNTTNSVVNALKLTNQQYALAERISKDALQLAQPGDHSQAILELQVTLPAFEKSQNGLAKNDDPSLGLPRRIPGDVQLLIIQSQSDFVALDSAGRSILKNADTPIDPNQLAIIQQHERPYFLTMNSVAKVWQSHIEDNSAAFFQIELSFGIGLLVLVMTHWILGKVIHIVGKRSDT